MRRAGVRPVAAGEFEHVEAQLAGELEHLVVVRIARVAGQREVRLLHDPSRRSELLDRRVSDSHKGFGIVTWHSKGFNQREELVIDFKRTNLVRLRNQ